MRYLSEWHRVRVRAPQVRLAAHHDDVRPARELGNVGQEASAQLGEGVGVVDGEAGQDDAGALERQVLEAAVLVAAFG